MDFCEYLKGICFVFCLFVLFVKQLKKINKNQFASYSIS